jgi:hypothetical protein
VATSRKVGAASCTLLAIYLLLSPIYALLNFEAFGSAAPQFLRYILAPAGLAALLLGIGWLARPDWAALTGITGLSVLLGLFADEALLTAQSVSVRLAMLGQVSATAQGRLDGDGTVLRGSTLHRLNSLAGTDKLSTAMLSGFPNSRAILCAPQDNALIYTADRNGFNNPDMIYETRIDLLLLGDSFVEGFCLPEGQDLASQLRHLGVATAGMGIRGNGPLLELAALGRFGDAIRPRHVAMVFFEGNDWENFEHELRSPWLKDALQPHADFGSQASAGQTMARARDAQQQASQETITFVDLLTRTEMMRNFFALQLTLTRFGLVYPKASRARPEFQETLRRAKALAERWGGQFSLVYLPRVDRYLGGSTQAAFDPLRRLVREAAAAEQIPVIDLHEAFDSLPEPVALYAADSHLSVEGAAVAADQIIRRLATLPSPQIVSGACPDSRMATPTSNPGTDLESAPCEPVRD